jgi:hypothetical protein
MEVVHREAVLRNGTESPPPGRPAEDLDDARNEGIERPADFWQLAVPRRVVRTQCRGEDCAKPGIDPSRRGGQFRRRGHNERFGKFQREAGGAWGSGRSANSITGFRWIMPFTLVAFRPAFSFPRTFTIAPEVTANAP